MADPFVRGQRVTPEMIDANHQVLLMHTKGKDAWTFFIVREAGRWRVNMDWMIEALKQPESAPRIAA